MHELTHCLAQLDDQADPDVETRLHQLTFEAFMLREESFRMQACDDNTKGMMFCNWDESKSVPGKYALLLVSSHYCHIRAAMSQYASRSGSPTGASAVEAVSSNAVDAVSFSVVDAVSCNAVDAVSSNAMVCHPATLVYSTLHLQLFPTFNMCFSTLHALLR